MNSTQNLRTTFGESPRLWLVLFLTKAEKSLTLHGTVMCSQELILLYTIYCRKATYAHVTVSLKSASITNPYPQTLWAGSQMFWTLRHCVLDVLIPMELLALERQRRLIRGAGAHCEVEHKEWKGDWSTREQTEGQRETDIWQIRVSDSSDFNHSLPMML